MSREVRRVPLDFDHPLNETWPGFLSPDSLHEASCPDCRNGYSPHAGALYDLWYGNLPFHPAITGSTPFTEETPAVANRARRNVESGPEFYRRHGMTVADEARRLLALWNGAWNHHLSQADVDVLAEAGRLRDFTHHRDPETGRLVPTEPTPPVLAREVNEWSLSGMGHDSISAHIVIEAHCATDGQPFTCGTCAGHGTVEKYPGQRAEADAWEPTPPPTGDGWQLWETVSEGSPISPVFADAESLAQWMVSDYRPVSGRHTIESARAFITAGWAPSLIGGPNGLVAGELAVTA